MSAPAEYSFAVKESASGGTNGELMAQLFGSKKIKYILGPAVKQRLSFSCVAHLYF